jgi:hypothetical protein
MIFDSSNGEVGQLIGEMIYVASIGIPSHVRSPDGVVKIVAGVAGSTW